MTDADSSFENASTLGNSSELLKPITWGRALKIGHLHVIHCRIGMMRLRLLKQSPTRRSHQSWTMIAFQKHSAKKGMLFLENKVSKPEEKESQKNKHRSTLHLVTIPKTQRLRWSDRISKSSTAGNLPLQTSDFSCQAKEVKSDLGPGAEWRVLEVGTKQKEKFLFVSKFHYQHLHLLLRILLPRFDGPSSI